MTVPEDFPFPPSDAEEVLQLREEAMKPKDVPASVDLSPVPGVPSVRWCAEQLHLSANYFGDLIKKMTGDTASNYIRQDLIQRVKNELASGANISQVAYELGFEYPQHLSRMFKKFCGYTPMSLLKVSNPYSDLFTNPV